MALSVRPGSLRPGLLQTYFSHTQSRSTRRVSGSSRSKFLSTSASSPRGTYGYRCRFQFRDRLTRYELAQIDLDLLPLVQADEIGRLEIAPFGRRPLCR